MPYLPALAASLTISSSGFDSISDQPVYPADAVRVTGRTWTRAGRVGWRHRLAVWTTSWLDGRGDRAAYCRTSLPPPRTVTPPRLLPPPPTVLPLLRYHVLPIHDALAWFPFASGIT